jgi:prephenate dehydratase
MLGDRIVLVCCDSFETLFDKVESGRAGYGIIPIENSLVGSIHRNYDLLLERNLNVIHVYSHPVALEQCRSFFRKHPHIAPLSYYDTAGAVKMLSEKAMPNSAAIAGPLAAELYNMKVLRKSIEDERSNFTRFLLLRRRPISVKGAAKTSIVFSMPDKPGGMFRALSVFALRDINLTKIESRPVRKKVWHYCFYIDFEGSIKEERVRYALDHLGEITHFIKILGSYPRAVTRDGH